MIERVSPLDMLLFWEIGPTHKECAHSRYAMISLTRRKNKQSKTNTNTTYYLMGARFMI
jgi:hypothetical protein